MEKVKLTVHGRMVKIKRELSTMKIPKSGHNKFAGFKYHELSDFLNEINLLNEKYGVNDFVEICENENECRITLVSTDDSSDFFTIRTPYKNAQMLGKGGAPSNVDEIQRAGATITYNRRYLYVTAYGINENCSVDAKEPVQKEEVKSVLPTFTEANFEKAKQNGATVEQIKKYYTLSLEIEKQYIDYVK
jgi:hypothetical protein